MKCRFVKAVYQNKESGYCVFVYRTDEPGVPEEARNTYYKGKGTYFTAIGSYLPDSDATETELKGKWIRNSRFGMQFQVESYEEFLPRSEEGIRAYLSSGMVKGIGPKTAELIVARFGARTFEVLEKYPDSLLEIKGITEKKLDVIRESYQASHALRDLAVYLAPFHITSRKLQKIYEEYGSASLKVVKTNPYTLCRINGFGFLTVDEIARANRAPLNDPLRIEGGIRYCMEQEAQAGNLYQDREIFGEKVHEQLNSGLGQEAVTDAEISREIYRLVTEKVLCCEDGMLYPADHYKYECGAAKAIARLLVQASEVPAGIESLIRDAQKDLAIVLSPKQEEAVRKAFSHLVSITTGGPGTGKTTVEKVELYVNERLGGKNVLLTAPTGMASRRMAVSTGQSAFTMHSALGLTGDEDERAAPEEMLEADFIIADEFTMSDMRLSYMLFSRIRKGARLVIVGDVNQLPSVGPGSVFRELVMCGIIPVTVLDTVFRQAKGSRIPANAKKIQDNVTSLDYGEDFRFLPAADAKEAADKVAELYQDYVEKYGQDYAQVLTPYRKRGDAGVDAMNERLRELVNPKVNGAPEIKTGRNSFRVGDRIIHNKNKNTISNGDIGYVREIFKDEDGSDMARLEFSEGRIVEYNSEDLGMVEHAYATTVHKSQGSEYPVVILPWLSSFYMMLRRNILYTAITRAKEAVIIVGEKRAVIMAIHNTEFDRRNTQLGRRIAAEYYRLKQERKAS